MKTKIYFAYQGVNYTLTDYAEGVVVPQIGGQIEFAPNGSSTYVQQRISDVIYQYEGGPENQLLVLVIFA